MKARRRALITGGSGQDAYYLREILLSEGYEVHIQTRGPVAQLDGGGKLVWHQLSLEKPDVLERLLIEVRPVEIYNFAAISRPQESWNRPLEVTGVNALVPLRILDCIRSNLTSCRLYQASSSEIFGSATEEFQDEATPLRPHNPYAIAKAYAHSMVGAFRRSYGLFACSGILFNHESPRRPLTYVSQKIAYAAAVIGTGASVSGERDETGTPIVSEGMLLLGNLDVRRDFGFAGDYMRAVWLMMQRNSPDDYVIGTGNTHSIRDICEVAFARVGRDWRDHVFVDQSLVRHVDSWYTRAGTAKVRRDLSWSPQVSFEELVHMMVDANLDRLERTKNWLAAGQTMLTLPE
jgi:GDPmannose 4,6-dehydratase